MGLNSNTGETLSRNAGDDTARWRESMLAKQSAMFGSRVSDLTNLIYGERAVVDDSAAVPLIGRSGQAAGDGGDSEDDSEDDDDLFALKQMRASEGALGGGTSTSGRDVDSIDSSYVRYNDSVLARWQVHFTVSLHCCLFCYSM